MTLWCVISPTGLHSCWNVEPEAQSMADMLTDGNVLPVVWPHGEPPSWAKLEALVLSHQGVAP